MDLKLDKRRDDGDTADGDPTNSEPCFARIPGPVVGLIERKHAEYIRHAVTFRWVYFATRLAAGLSAALIPFMLGRYDEIATGLSVTVAIATVVDLVFAPKDRWTLYSKASDLLTVAKIRALGHYDDASRELIEVLLSTESAALQQVMNLDEMVRQIEKARTK